MRVRLIAIAGAAAAAGTYLARRAPRRLAYPPGEGAIRPEDARETAAQLLTGPKLRREDLVMDFAPAIATAVDPLLHGRRYFPRMLEDIEAAKDHVHLLIYGYKAGDIGATFRDLLTTKVREGVEVRLEVDAIGSEIDLGSRGLFRELLDGGVEIVANDGVLIARSGYLRVRRPALRYRDTLHFDHRKMAVIDGRVAYVGGSGIEDHYNDERFYDVMCRVEGPIVAPLQLVFLASWRYHGGPAEVDGPTLDRWFPDDVLQVPDGAALRSPTTILWNVPGTGHHPISDAIERSLEDATSRIDIVNPYISNRAILVRILEAARRGVAVRLVAPGKPTPPYPAAAFRHHYQRLLDAGVEILLHPEMAHAKVLRIDDRVFVGGCNLDDLSLFRNDELDLLFEDPAVVVLTERAIFGELVGMSMPATVATRRQEILWNAAMDRFSRWL
jgi:cardiolipin synthase